MLLARCHRSPMRYVHSDFAPVAVGGSVAVAPFLITSAQTVALAVIRS